MTAAPRYHPGLFESEIFWAECYPALLEKGYQLRSRYRANWSRTWRWRFTFWPKSDEEEVFSVAHNTLDAVRLSDNKKIVLKRVASASPEIKIHEYLNSKTMHADPRNHTIDVLDVFSLPNTSWSFLVLPYAREFDYPPFHCRSEVVNALSQYLEGLQFMHEHNVVHMDIAPQNMLMDESAVVPNGSHFALQRTHDGEMGLFTWNDRCTASHLRYYYIDFGLSEYFPEGPEEALTTGMLRTFPEIPELSYDVPYNPFKVDIFQLGLVIRKLVQVGLKTRYKDDDPTAPQAYPDLEDFRPVSDAMTSKDPVARPSAAQSLRHLQSIAATLSPEQLSEQIWDRAATEAHKQDRVKLGGYRFDYEHIRDRALYGRCALDVGRTDSEVQRLIVTQAKSGTR
ncbi:Protein kinase domain-containing protein [Mycena kentingensis (nom. inval.)]|nr:Protein kinase domain-containing protein [Mycena kentingensis (nom. inval.)]